MDVLSLNMKMEKPIEKYIGFQGKRIEFYIALLASVASFTLKKMLFVFIIITEGNKTVKTNEGATLKGMRGLVDVDMNALFVFLRGMNSTQMF